MNIDLKNTWEEFDKEFNIEKKYHIFALSNLIRYSLEEENLKKSINDVDYSIMHNFLHSKSVATDELSFLKSLIKNIIILPNIYEYKNILNKLLQKTKMFNEEDFFHITNTPSKSKNDYLLKINSISIFSYDPIIYVYTGRKKRDDRNSITFLGNEKLEIGNVYRINVGYGMINNQTSMFIMIGYQNISLKMKQDILNEYSVKEPKDLFKKIEGNTLPYDQNKIMERQIMSDIASYYSNPVTRIMENKSWYPFMLKPYINKAPNGLSIYYLKKIIKSYGLDYSNYENQYNIKKY